MMDIGEKSTTRLGRVLRELVSLPESWKWKVNHDDAERVYFFDTRTKYSSTYNHPALGQLPISWILRLHNHEGKNRLEYYHTESEAVSADKDPRIKTASQEIALLPAGWKTGISKTYTMCRQIVFIAPSTKLESYTYPISQYFETSLNTGFSEHIRNNSVVTSPNTITLRPPQSHRSIRASQALSKKQSYLQAGNGELENQTEKSASLVNYRRR
jgi:hypothetical protein